MRTAPGRRRRSIAGHAIGPASESKTKTGVGCVKSPLPHLPFYPGAQTNILTCETRRLPTLINHIRSPRRTGSAPPSCRRLSWRELRTELRTELVPCPQLLHCPPAKFLAGGAAVATVGRRVPVPAAINNSAVGPQGANTRDLSH